MIVAKFLQIQKTHQGNDLSSQWKIRSSWFWKIGLQANL
jgi:hypothetical protein